MFSLIPLPYRILGAALLAALIFAGGVSRGYQMHKDETDAAETKAIKAANAQYRAEAARGNKLAAQLAQAESATKTQTIEVIKYVPKVTTGQPCLSAGAVGLLNGTSHPLKLRQAAGQPAAEDAAPLAASDRDAAYWIAGANSQYDICAERLNTLIDYETARPE